MINSSLSMDVLMNTCSTFQDIWKKWLWFFFPKLVEWWLEFHSMGVFPVQTLTNSRLQHLLEVQESASSKTQPLMPTKK